MSSHPVAGLPPTRPTEPTRSDPTLCVLCPKLCRFACPVAQATADESATPTGMLQVARDARAGRLPWSLAAEAAALCTGCEACRPPCEFEQDVPAMLRQVRAEAFDRGEVPQGARQVHDKLLRDGSPFGATGAAPETDAHKDSRGRVLYWPGCRLWHDGGARLDADMRLFEALGADHLSLPARKDVPHCCGGAAWVLGDVPGLQVAAAGLDQYFNRQRTVVAASSLCLRTVEQGWPEQGHSVRGEVLHTAEYLLFFRARLAELGARVPAVPVTVHESCGLHRRLGRGSAVSEVLATVLGHAPARLAVHPDRELCCGGGDLFDLREPERSRDVATRLRPDDEPAAGSTIVTGDPECVPSLRLRFPKHRILDLMAFLATHLAAEMVAPRPPVGTRASDGR